MPKLSFEQLVGKRQRGVWDDHQIEKKLGDGCSGEVFQVIHKSSGSSRALKRIRKSKGLSLNQVQLLKTLDHPNILRVLQYYQDQQHIYVITELFRGKELFQEIVTSAESEAFITQLEAAQIMRQVLSALAYAHARKLVHRDVKPQNILLRREKDLIQVKVIDWGLATLISEGGLKLKCGTPQYCAPEVLTRQYDQKIDVWSCGAVLFTTLSGTLPFKGSKTQETLAKVARAKFCFDGQPWDHVSQSCKDFIRKLMSKNPKIRPTAKQCLQHAWLSAPQKTPSKQQSKIFLGKLSKFNVQNKFQASALAYIARHLLTLKQEASLRRLFGQIDLNKDGVISQQQLVLGFKRIEGVLTEEQARALFSKLDIDESGSISYNQFITAFVAVSQEFSQRQMKVAFDLFDQNGDGQIDIEEIVSTLGASEQDKVLWLPQLSQFDSDKNGKVNYKEFKNMMSVIGGKVNKQAEPSKKAQQQKDSSRKRLTRSQSLKNDRS